jgi:hypothetical protein
MHWYGSIPSLGDVRSYLASNPLVFHPGSNTGIVAALGEDGTDSMRTFDLALGDDEIVDLLLGRRPYTWLMFGEDPVPALEAAVRAYDSMAASIEARQANRDARVARLRTERDACPDTAAKEAVQRAYKAEANFTQDTLDDMTHANQKEFDRAVKRAAGDRKPVDMGDAHDTAWWYRVPTEALPFIVIPLADQYLLLPVSPQVARMLREKECRETIAYLIDGHDDASFYANVDAAEALWVQTIVIPEAVDL